MREELSALERAHSRTLRIVHALEKPTQGWTGASGFDSELIKTHVPPAELGEKVKVFVCGASLSLSLPCFFCLVLCADDRLLCAMIGPAGQVSAVAGKWEGMKQGTVIGVFKQLGYSGEQI